LEPRKDLDTVLDAFEQLWIRGEDIALLLIGNEGWNVEKLTKRIRQNQDNGRPLLWLQGASDDDVKQLLKNATALIQASFAEGFGLPIIEAGSLGVRLLLSDLPVFRDIALDEAVYFPVGQPASLVSAIRRALSGTVQSPRAIKTMTWQESAEKLSHLLL
jgi:glycosyltransferase involved in cell wall biosynthesis